MKFSCWHNVHSLNKYWECEMSNHEADIKNKNKGTPGTNKTYDKGQGNRGKQIKENQQRQKTPVTNKK